MKRAWVESKSHQSLELAFRLSRLAGIFPLDLIEGNFVLSLSGILCSSMLVILLILYIFAHAWVSSPRIYASKLSSILNFFQLVAFEACVFFSILFVIWNRRSLSRVENTLMQLEYYMFRLGVEVDQKMPYGGTMAIMLSTWSVFVLDCTLLDRVGFWEVFYLFGHYHLAFLIALVNAKMSSLADRIGSGFESLTCALEAAVEPTQLTQWHQRLSANIGLLTRVYSVELLTLFATALFSCTVEAYLAIRVFRTGSVAQSIVYVFWTCVLYCICFRIIAVCVRVRAKAMEFDASLYRLILNNENGDFSFYGSAYKLYFHYCSKSRVSISALGFFKIDWHLATTMIASACTYVVLLVQYAE